MRPEPTVVDVSTPRRTSPLAALFGLVEADRIRALLPVVVIAASSGRFVLVVGLAAVAGLVYGVLSWWRRTWCFVDGVLHLDEGVLVRNQRRIPVERIQHVELERRLRHQALDLAALRIETAGGSGAELRLEAIPLAEAHATQALVLAGRRPGAADATAGPSSPEVLVRLPWHRLLLAGITGPEVAAVLAALAVGFDTLTDLGLEPSDVDPQGVDAGQISTLAVVVLLLVVVPVWLLVAGIIGVVRRWDLTAVIDGDELRVTYGLLRRAELVLSVERVQDARIAHRLLLRPFGRADLRVRTAASGAGEQSRVDIPLLDPDEVERILARVLPSALPMPSLRPAPPGARRRALVRGGVGGAVFGTVVVAAGLVLGWRSWITIVGALSPVVGLASGEASYRGLGAWFGDERGGVVHSRSGAFTRNHAIVPSPRVQSGSVVASWFQRRRGLATTRLDLAGAAVDVIDRDLVEARAVLDRAVLGGV